MENSKKKNILHASVTVLLFSCLLFPRGGAQAAAWPAIDPYIKQQLEIYQDTYYGYLMMAVKTAAVQTLNQQVNSLVGGGSMGEALYITDWRQDLVVNPATEATNYFNAYLDQSTSGRGSYSNYVPNSPALLVKNSEGVGPGAFTQGLAMENPVFGRLISPAGAAGFSISGSLSAGNYINQLISEAKKAAYQDKALRVTYVGNPSQMFMKPNMKQMSIYLDTEADNDPWSYKYKGKLIYENLLSQQINIATAKSIAYSGFKGAGSGGKITNPGSLVKDSVSKVQNMGVDVVTSATKFQEVIVGIVSQMITKSISQGIGEVKSNVNREFSSVRSQFQSQLQKNVNANGPRALYGR